MESPIELEVGCRAIHDGLSKLSLILQGVAGVSFSSDEYSTLYRTIYRLCTQCPPHNYSQEMYFCYKILLQRHLKSIVLPSLKEKHSEFLLRELVDAWRKHNLLVRWLSRFFNYLDTHYVDHNFVMPLKELGMSSFYDLVFNEIKSTVAAIVIEMVDNERDGLLIDRALVKDVLDIYIDIGRNSMGLYQLFFEEAFLKGSSDYYSKKAQTWMLEYSCPKYLFKVEVCFQKEKERVVNYLHASTESKLLQITFNELIHSRAEQIVNSGCMVLPVLLLDGKTEDLSRMYRYFSKMDDRLSVVSQIFKEHVNEEGMSLLRYATDAANIRKNEKNEVACSWEQDFVLKVIMLHDKYLRYVTNCFQNNATFHEALKEGFGHFCNNDVAGCTSAELIAAFCDNILQKGGSKKPTGVALEETLDKVVNILTYISDKDLFVEFHRRKLGNRLLFDKSVNNEYEISFVSKLRQYFGGQLTSKMEVMLTDILTAKDLHTDFEAYMNSQREYESLPRVDLSVTVLTTGLWPSYKTLKINLPTEMIKCVEAFNNYYKIKQQSKRLNWIYSMGSCNIMATFDTKPIELIVNTYQAAILFLFNDSDRLSFADIGGLLNFPHDELARVLHSLSCAKYKILEKEPSNRTISPTDKFVFNQKFSDKMHRIKVPLPPTDEKKKVIGDVENDRRFSIDATIVRIMKSRKVLGHQQLVQECVNQLKSKFQPDDVLIKKRIDDLITREYIKREKPSTYEYIS